MSKARNSIVVRILNSLSTRVHSCDCGVHGLTESRIEH